MEIQENISLKRFNTFGIDVIAKQLARFTSVDELHELLAYNQAQTANSKHQTLILGGGSNLLFTSNVDGLVLKNEIPGIREISEDAHHMYVQAGAGVNWHQFVLHCISKGWAGVENLSLIPGNVGASPMQNIGAYGVEIKDVFYSLEALHLPDNKIVHFSLNDCAFGYRESVFKRKYRNEFVITHVTFRLNRVPQFNTSYGAIEQELEKMGVKELSIQAVSQAVINIRSSKLPDPAEIGNAGSFFKNPSVPAADVERIKTVLPDLVTFPGAEGTVKLAAGQLIEKAGWKGFREKGYGVHKDQALVLVNHGGATGSQLYDLSTRVLESVRERFGVELEREVNII